MFLYTSQIFKSTNVSAFIQRPSSSHEFSTFVRDQVLEDGMTLQWCRRRGGRGGNCPPPPPPPTLGHDCTLKFNEEKISSCSMSATVAT